MADNDIRNKIINGIKDWFDNTDSYYYADNHHYTVYTIKDYDKGIVEYTAMVYAGRKVQLSTGNLDIENMVKYYKQQAAFYGQTCFWDHHFIEGYFEAVVKKELPNKDTIIVNLRRLKNEQHIWI